MKANYHTHSTWCDGAAGVEEMILGALEKGFTTIGFSSHAMLPGDPYDWTLTTDTIADYAEEVRTLAKKYADDIRVLCGIEADYIPNLCTPDRRIYAPIAPDYLIGSVHYVLAPDGARACVDKSPESFARDVRDHFGGQVETFVRAYFAAQREMASSFDFDVIGHPDLIRKFNGRLGYLDETVPWYREELERTADAFAASGKIVEVNTGAISRGWMEDAYPSADFRFLLRARGVRFILSSDAHSAPALDCAFDRFADAETYVHLCQ